MSTTLVSAFVSNVNEKYADTLTRYHKFGQLLLKSHIPKIIFLDGPMMNLIGNNYNKSTTLVVKTQKSDIYLYEYKDSLSNFHIHSTDHTKDTIEFMFTMCNKTEWVREAILLNYFKTDNFIWVDFGLRHVFDCSDDEFVNKINGLAHKSYPSVRMGTIWNVNSKFNIDIYKDIAWYFAGGVFGGNADSLVKFSELMKDKCIDIMTNKNTIMWEVNIWYLIYTENSAMFDTYCCNHDYRILDNY
jgi:hypothetical protein